MLKIINKITPGGHKPRMRDPEVVAVHRISFAADPLMPIEDRELTAEMVMAKFSERDKYRPGYYTGGMMPYTFLDHVDGRVEQCVELRDSAPHAARWNARAIGIGVVGDFRYHHPSPAQLESLFELCSLLAKCGLTIFGHTELPDATRDAAKVCPGRMLDIDRVRHAAYGSLPCDGTRRPIDWLSTQGVTL